MKKGVVILLAATFLSSCFSDLTIPGDPFNDEFPGGNGSIGDGSIGGNGGNGNGQGGSGNGNSGNGGIDGDNGNGNGSDSGNGSDGNNGNGNNNGFIFNHKKRNINADAYRLGGVVTPDPNNSLQINVSSPLKYNINEEGSFFLDKTYIDSTFVHATPANKPTILNNRSDYNLYNDNTFSIKRIPFVYSIFTKNPKEKVILIDDNFNTNKVLKINTTSCDEEKEGKCIKKIYVAQLYLMDEWYNSLYKSRPIYYGLPSFYTFGIRDNNYPDKNDKTLIYTRSPQNADLERRLPEVFKNYSQYYKSDNDAYTNKVIEDIKTCKSLGEKCSFNQQYDPIENEYINYAGFVYTSKVAHPATQDDLGRNDEYLEIVSKNLDIIEISYEIDKIEDNNKKLINKFNVYGADFGNVFIITVEDTVKFPK